MRSLESRSSHIGFAAHLIDGPRSLASWSLHRNRIVTDAAEPADRSTEPRFGPPEVRFATAAAAAAWFGHLPEATVFTWTLADPKGQVLAASAAAFPAIMMAELDARRIQEFADELQLELVADPGGRGFAWVGYRDGVGILTFTAWHAERTDALQEATIAVGLLPVASVAQYAILAD